MKLQSMLTRQRPLIIDGGLATELEKRGASLKSKLWSAQLLSDNPNLIRQVHYDFLVAGADIIITASYQASIPGFIRTGVSAEEAVQLIKLSVDLACQARDEFCTSQQSRKRLRPMVAASIGPYGASLADGSEFHGDYGKTKQELINFHRPRMEILSRSKADLLAFETIPSQLEAEALLELLGEFPESSAWLSFSCKDGESVSHGESFARCVEQAVEHPQIQAVGVNCTRPEFVSGLLRNARHSDTPLIAYPNSGELWDKDDRNWTGEGSILAANSWFAAGARLIGGCCRVSPEQISRLRKSLL